MNMRIHINKKLAQICFLILLFLCMYSEAQRDTEFVHKEIVENQRRLMGTEELEFQGRALEDRGSLATSGSNATTESTNSTENDPSKGSTAPANNTNKFTFWSGFVDSLSMIFFVEFGDRVLSPSLKDRRL